MKITGTGSAMPSLAVTNDMLSEFLDTNDEWISTRTGIKERRIISDETLTSLAVDAAKKAIESAGLTPNDIDYFLCSNVVNNFVTPSLSCILQGEIGANCPSLDLNAACTGFIYALDIAESFIQTGRAENVLIVCAEEPTRMVNWKERNTCVLFGDGAGAVVVSKGDAFKAFHISTQSKIEPLYYQRKLEYNPYQSHPDGDAPLIMNGKDVFKLAVSSSVSDIRNVLEKSSLNADDIKYYLLHQANIRIIDTIRDFLKQPDDKFPHNIENYGNTSSASIPILLDEMRRAGKFTKGDMLLFSAFGAGFTTGACVLEWNM
ncbi:ketoacyl-ACP synthase III [Bacteroidales bacterium OttesenSCG-928-B11]|nr:ketoacyl-ACP synthase III [Bacteroidales bacterium OttesenSCG-928-C03]MDL2312635.1 ketoacyl-ACP synthase III [Bacteroidales bacterium OttesenSCG-928-B11]MDL2326105.1 ketoacyl-ACP synthase III [Bacteroidales bacterium OttesenSCG-928-A14]